MSKRGRFEGWYYKHQTSESGSSLAVIPGRVADHAFVLVNTDGASYKIEYPISEYHKSDMLRVGNNIFSQSGISLNIQRSKLNLMGEIKYGSLAPIRYDIMGPFKFFPMECRHGITSMQHSLCGSVIINGITHNFTNGLGYIESDSGRSFPGGYTWVHCNDFRRNCSIMVSVAKIPFYGLKFWGCICVVWLDGREYRLATYKGVKILQCNSNVIELKQGKYKLTVEIDSHIGQQLAAPKLGKMSNIIRETLSCSAKFKFEKGSEVLFEEESKRTSAEYEMSEEKFCKR